MDRYQRFKLLDSLGDQILPVLMALPDREVPVGARPSYDDAEIAAVVEEKLGDGAGQAAPQGARRHPRRPGAYGVGARAAARRPGAARRAGPPVASGSAHSIVWTAASSARRSGTVDADVVGDLVGLRGPRGCPRRERRGDRCGRHPPRRRRRRSRSPRPTCARPARRGPPPGPPGRSAAPGSRRWPPRGAVLPNPCPGDQRSPGREALVERLGEPPVVGHAVAVALGLVLVVDAVAVVALACRSRTSESPRLRRRGRRRCPRLLAHGRAPLGSRRSRGPRSSSPACTRCRAADPRRSERRCPSGRRSE